MTSGNGQLEASPRFDKLVRQYVEIRDRIKEIETLHKEQLAPFEDAKAKLAALLLRVLDEAGAESVRTNMGTVSTRVRYTAPLSDPDMFMEYVIDNQLYELLDRRANATACHDHAKNHAGILPPGVKLNAIRSIGVRTS
jgi:hypothetical protein